MNSFKIKMFSVFLKAKYEIEAKINSLQRTYLDLLNAPIREIQFNVNNNKEKAQQIITEKLEILSKIKEEYQAALNQCEGTRFLLVETKEIAEETETHLSSLFETFGIEIPEDLERKEESTKESAQNLAQNLHTTRVGEATQDIREEEEDKENSYLYQDEESLDKENFQSPNSDEYLSPNEYFSPNIKFRKSFKSTTNAECFTPAVKSSSKFKPSTDSKF